MTMNLKGYILCPEIHLLVYFTWDDNVIQRDNYVMMMSEITSILVFKAFQNVRKPLKITEKY